jgi:hypothetical protein
MSMLNAEPYRVPVEPEESRKCPSCGKKFRAKVSSTAVQCALCHVKTLEMQTSNQSHEIARAEERIARSRRNYKIVKWVSLTLILIFGGIFKVQMRKDRVAMHAAAHGYDTTSNSTGSYPSYGEHVMAEGVEHYTREMCSCADTTCARDVRDKFQQFKQSTDADIPEGDRDEIAKNIDRMDDCSAKVWEAARKNPSGNATASSYGPQ